MPELEQSEWEKINEIVNQINEINDITAMRKNFLQELYHLVYFDLADFCLSRLKGAKNVVLTDPVVYSRYSSNFEKLFTLKYENQFEQLDYTRWIYFNLESTVFRESDIINREARLNSSYYIDYLKPLNLINVAGMSLAQNGIHLGAANLYRTAERGDFEDRDLYILKQFLPHLKRRLMVEYKKTELNAGKYDKITAILKSEFNLSKREIEIVKLVCTGCGNKEISEKLSITTNTVKKHMGNILYKLHVENRLQLINFLIRTDKDLFVLDES